MGYDGVRSGMMRCGFKIMEEKMADYMESTTKLGRQELAWRTGGLKFMLALMIKEFGFDKVEKELQTIKIDDLAKRLFN